MRIAIIDDELDARKTFRVIVENFIEEKIEIEEYDGVKSAIPGLLEKNYDLVFLDINLNDGDGFDILDIVKHRQFKIVFLTAYSNFAIKAFKYSAFEYLLKPISIKDIRSLFEKLKELNVISEQQQNLFFEKKFRTQLNSLTLSSHQGYELINLNDIVKIEANKSYCVFYLVDLSRRVSTKNLGYYEDLLPSDTFLRVHNSSIVNSIHIKSYNKDGKINLASNLSQVVSKRRRSYFLSLFEKLFLKNNN